MRTSDFEYDLPPERIAQTPIEPRDHSRLLVYDGGDIRHEHFYDLVEHLRPGDALAINETRVLPARIYGTRRGTGARVEFLLLKRLESDLWEALVKPGRRARPGDAFDMPEGASARIESTVEASGGRIVRFSCAEPFEQWLERVGTMPLPPYIHERLDDQERYQTVYAHEKGSAAAPTAGLHFTPELLQRIRDKGVTIAPILLHVGLGTFRPVTEGDVGDHVMHSEWYRVPPETADALNAARASGHRIVCVGTTTVRALESCAQEDGTVRATSGDTSIFITPGYRFRAVDALVTNFHLPGSTLLMLVSALMGREEALRTYRIAVEEGYRFFSFGDAMLILPNGEGDHV